MTPAEFNDLLLKKFPNFYKKWGNFRTESPDLLYHYSDIFVLNSILQSQTVWGTYVKQTNDKKEFIIGFDIFINVIEEKIAKFNFLNPEKLIQFLKHYKINSTNFPFIFCLSEKKDLLSQWRGYANFGSGASIGIKLKSFEPKDCILGKVIYDELEKIKIANEVIEDFLKEHQLNCLKSSEKDTWKALGVLLQIIEMQSLFFKDVAFQEEAEWRLICLHDSSDMPKELIHTSARNNKIYLHRHIQLMPETIQEVVFGPLAKEESEISIEILKAQYGYKFVTTKSIIPFHA